jgi:choline-glycine betaine transporter
MISNTVFILLTSFILLAIILLLLSKKFRKSVFGHMFDWMAKKVSRALIYILGFVLVALVVGFFGSK